MYNLTPIRHVRLKVYLLFSVLQSSLGMTTGKQIHPTYIGGLKDMGL